MHYIFRVLISFCLELCGLLLSMPEQFVAYLKAIGSKFMLWKSKTVFSMTWESNYLYNTVILAYLCFYSIVALLKWIFKRSSKIDSPFPFSKIVSKSSLSCGRFEDEGILQDGKDLSRNESNSRKASLYH